MKKKEVDGQMDLFAMEAPKKKKEVVQEEKNEKKPIEKVEKIKRKREVVKEYHVAMQRSFLLFGEKIATVAYIDYNMVYVKPFDGKETLTLYADAKQAVDAYAATLEQLQQETGAKAAKEHPALVPLIPQDCEEN